MASKKQMTTREAIFAVLTDGGTMKVPDIIAQVLKRATGLKGKTPGQTVYSILYAENKKKDGAFQKAGKGTFKLRSGATLTATTPASKPKAAKPKSSKRAEELSPIAGAVVLRDGGKGKTDEQVAEETGGEVAKALLGRTRQAKPDPKPGSRKATGRAKGEAVASS